MAQLKLCHFLVKYIFYCIFVLMKDTVYATLKSDFEKFMRHSMHVSGAFGFDVFGDYVTSVLNFYVGSSVLTLEEKVNAAFYLCQLYNKGLKNMMSVTDMKEMSIEFANDPTLDYTVLSPIFD